MMLETLEEIYSWVEEHCNKVYFEKEDFNIDSKGLVNYTGEEIISLTKNMNNIEKIPFNFGYINSAFEIKGKEINTLKGCPININGFFSVSNTAIINLKNMPKKINGYLFIHTNILLDDLSDLKKPKKLNDDGDLNKILINKINIGEIDNKYFKWNDTWNNSWEKEDRMIYMELNIELIDEFIGKYSLDIKDIDNYLDNILSNNFKVEGLK